MVAANCAARVCMKGLLVCPWRGVPTPSSDGFGSEPSRDAGRAPPQRLRSPGAKQGRRGPPDGAARTVFVRRRPREAGAGPPIAPESMGIPPRTVLEAAEIVDVQRGAVIAIGVGIGRGEAGLEADEVIDVEKRGARSRRRSWGSRQAGRTSRERRRTNRRWAHRGCPSSTRSSTGSRLHQG
jgi:hypothetical protein